MWPMIAFGMGGKLDAARTAFVEPHQRDFAEKPTIAAPLGGPLVIGADEIEYSFKNVSVEFDASARQPGDVSLKFAAVRQWP